MTHLPSEAAIVMSSITAFCKCFNSSTANSGTCLSGVKRIWFLDIQDEERSVSSVLIIRSRKKVGVRNRLTNSRIRNYRKEWHIPQSKMKVVSTWKTITKTSEKNIT